MLIQFGKARQAQHIDLQANGDTAMCGRNGLGGCNESGAAHAIQTHDRDKQQRVNVTQRSVGNDTMK